MKSRVIIKFSVVTVLSAVINAATIAQTQIPQQAPADTIYIGGDILTMAGDEPEYAAALVVTRNLSKNLQPLASFNQEQT